MLCSLVQWSIALSQSIFHFLMETRKAAYSFSSWVPFTSPYISIITSTSPMEKYRTFVYIARIGFILSCAIIWKLFHPLWMGDIFVFPPRSFRTTKSIEVKKKFEKVKPRINFAARVFHKLIIVYFYCIMASEADVD